MVASAAESIIQAVDTFQVQQPRGQIRRSDIKRMVASLVVHAPEDPVAFLDNLIGKPQTTDRRPVWAASKNFDLKLSTSSTETGGWSGKVPAYFSNPVVPGGLTVLDSRTRMVRAFPDETDSRVQARLQRMVADIEQIAAMERRNRDDDRRVGKDEPAPPEPQQVASVQVEITSVALGADQPSQLTQTIDEWRTEVAAFATQTIDDMIMHALDKVVIDDGGDSDGDGDSVGTQEQEHKSREQAADASPSTANLEE